MTTRSRRAALLFLIAATLATPALPAVFLPDTTASAGLPVLQPGDLLERLWNALNRWQAKNGCSADPDGRCLASTTALTTDNGCQLDPNGRCLPKSRTALRKNGCSADPSGRCLP